MMYRVVLFILLYYFLFLILFREFESKHRYFHNHHTHKLDTVKYTALGMVCHTHSIGYSIPTSFIYGISRSH